MAKPKKKKCKNPECLERFVPFNSLQKTCWKVECSLAVGQKELERRKKREQKEYRAETRRRKEKTLTVKDWVSKAQTKINRLVVLEDAPKGCISCGSGQVTDSGHYYHRGSKYRVSWLTLSRINLNGQCRHCNSFKGGGNQAEYRIGYIQRYGEEQFNALEELKRQTDRGEIAPPTIEELKEFIAKYTKKIKEIEGR